MLQPSFLGSLTQRNFVYPYSLLFGFFSGSLLTLCVTAYLLNKNQHFQHRYLAESFGQVMITMAAQQAMDATLNHDYLSLQILLEDITQHTPIINAAIYDVENTLIVQAGETGNSIKERIHHINAPIALHDTVSGYIVLAIDTAYPSNINYTILLVLFIGILITLAVFCLYRGWLPLQPDSKFSNENEDAQQTNSDHLEKNNKNDKSKGVLLSLDVKNIDELYKKLNGDLRKKAINQFHQHIQKALSLYNGALLYIGSSAVVLSFEEGDLEQHNAIFNAVCCGYLIRELNEKQGNFPLVVGAYIHHIPEKTITDQQLSLLHYNNIDDTAQLIIEKELLENNNLENYLVMNTEKNNTHFVCVRGFQKNYSKLLDNQLKHLQASNR